MSTAYALSVELPLPLPAALQRLRAALAAEQLGVVSDIDLQATLKAKLGRDTRPTRLLGVCNLAVAQALLEADADVAALLPCGCGLTEQPPGHTRIVLQDPRAIALLSDLPGVRAACERARVALVRVIQRLSPAG